MLLQVLAKRGRPLHETVLAVRLDVQIVLVEDQQRGLLRQLALWRHFVTMLHL
jgi:hypothetical protein